MQTDDQWSVLLQSIEAKPAHWLECAHDLKLSDIHLTPTSGAYRISARCDGRLVEVGALSTHSGQRFIQRMKSAAKMNITESRTPQDGRVQGDSTQARLATHPTLNGECLSIRVLGLCKRSSLNTLSLLSPDQRAIETLFEKPDGLLLVSGPTGSGKTTLLHAGLQTLGARAGRIATLEDPVEIHNDQAVQTDLSLYPHLSFADGLRSLMRQDPDTILVGEVRDSETARLCLNAAFTGHRVLATVHAPDPMGTVHRMLELGIDLTSLLNCLNGVVHCRLGLCPTNKVLQQTPSILSLLQTPKHSLLDVKGLAQLHNLLQCSS